MRRISNKIRRAPPPGLLLEFGWVQTQSRSINPIAQSGPLRNVNRLPQEQGWQVRPPPIATLRQTSCGECPLSYRPLSRTPTPLAPGNIWLKPVDLRVKQTGEMELELASI